MNASERDELYQELILEHNKKPRNYRKIDNPSHAVEGYNPICGDHIYLYLKMDENKIIEDIAFEGSGCAISKSSASLLTMTLKGKTEQEARQLFAEFHDLLTGKMDLQKSGHHLGKLAVFSGIWQYPSRIKCASLAWHALESALKDGKKQVSTE
ncbi:MAG: SUF system NifU family Fe-S cluster assembly protein [Candidatus Aureabacteria bacterium]|nr:SUF system NifU family Fe-S cluster assembly protein [Candidatus Auribacterota bacterium]